ncbi:MAG: ABC transporter permease, partial [Chloroflexota bacterium]
MENKANNIKPRWRKVISDLWDNKVRTSLVVASIAVGVFAVGTIANAFIIISEDISVGYSSANPANIEVWVDSFQEDLSRSIEKMPEVAEAEGRHIFSGRL